MREFKKHTKKLVIALVVIVALQSLIQMSSVDAEQKTYWYSQKGLTYHGTALTSMCYITCYAMILKNLGLDADPISVYVANDYSNYANHNKIGTAYNVDTSDKGDLSTLTASEKKEKIRTLLKEHPEGIIVGGCYSGSSYHYIVAVKADDNNIYFDDPAYANESDGCCITLNKTWKLTWNNLSMYRIIKKNNTTTPASTEVVPTEIVPEADATPAPTTSISTPEPTPASTDINEYIIPTRTIYFTDPIMKGEDVKWVQAALYTLGYDISIDGSFGKSSKKTVKIYQSKNSLTSDGYVGSKTRKAILKSLEVKAAKEKLKKVTKMSAVTNKVLSSNIYSAVISWKKQTVADGYQVVYADNEKFASKITKNILKNRVKLTKLVPNNTYYIKTRAYTLVDGVKVYGKFSSVTKIKALK